MEPSPDDPLRAAGLRRTPARLAVWRALAAARRPLTHAELRAEQALADLDEITLYRTLSTFEAVGLVHRVVGPDGAARVGANPASGGCPGNHAHFLCSGCGTMVCLPEQPMPRMVLPAGTDVRWRQWLAVGRCARCR